MAGIRGNLLLLGGILLGLSVAACSRSSGETPEGDAAAVAAAAPSGRTTESVGSEPIAQVSNPSGEHAAGAGVADGSADRGAAAASSDAADTGAAGASSGAAGSVAGAPASSTDAVAAPASQAASEPGLRILVSIAKRRLWLVDGADTLLKAPVAIGMGKDFRFADRTYHFATPKGTRKVLAKAKDPLWIVPEWHYYEKAAAMRIGEVVKLEDDANIVLADSSILTIQDHQVGRINHFGYFAPFTPGTEIVFDGRLYVPPVSTVQRKVPNALGPYKLDMGDGYLIHGTHLYNEESIGDAVSHGCVRMTNEDLTRLYPLVPRGTPVIIF